MNLFGKCDLKFFQDKLVKLNDLIYSCDVRYFPVIRLKVYIPFKAIVDDKNLEAYKLSPIQKSKTFEL